MPVSTIHTAASGTKEIDLSLQRITQLLQRLSSPQSKFPIIHVAGTNSKGSTIAYLGSILNDCVGISTGSFTSPHLKIERDCCKVGNQVIDENVWDEAGKLVAEADMVSVSSSSSSSSTSSTGPLHSSPFEILTARCFTAFNLLPPTQRPEVLLVEVGMGGALDATNVFLPSQVLASVICPIDYDHQAFLGDTLSEIALQKAGIVKAGGLCVLADQRRQGSDSSDQVECTKVKAENEQVLEVEGREAAEVQEIVRRICASLNARLVKAYVPWHSLSVGYTSVVNGQSPWSAHVSTNIRYAPVLLPSKVHQGDYTSSAGDPVVPGPALLLPRTRAALTGCHLALQTLWSIARDETPCALGEPGSDSSEGLRLRIAYGLRDDRLAKSILDQSVQQTRIQGRAEWVDLQLKEATSTLVEDDDDNMQVDNNNNDKNDKHEDFDDDDKATKPPLHLHALVDGAHNPSAALALHGYVKECIQQRIKTSKQQVPSSSAISHVTVTWIIAFSKGKAISEIIGGLFGDAGNGIDNLTTQFTDSLLDAHIEHKVACLPFTTPVEGMPWVDSVPAEEVAVAFRNHTKSLVDVKEFSDLTDALLWASKEGDGKSVTNQRSNVVVIAGSLYLVSDVHRLLPDSGLP